MAHLQITLPYPPSINHYWRHWHGRPILSAEGRQYRKTADLEIAAQLLTQYPAAPPPIPLSGLLAVTVHVYVPDRRRRDLDNVLKAIYDALTHAGVIADDFLIDEGHQYRHPPTSRHPGGAVVLEILQKPPTTR